MKKTIKQTMSKKMTLRLTLLSSAAMLAALLLTSQTTHAYDNQQAEQKSSDRRGPPPAAFTACEDKNEGDQSQFETRRGNTLAGTCEEHGGKLVLRPDNKQMNNKRRTPPAAAFTACEGKSEGETSKFNNRHGKTLTGTCEVANGKLVLRPQRFDQS